MNVWLSFFKIASNCIFFFLSYSHDANQFVHSQTEEREKEAEV